MILPIRRAIQRVTSEAMGILDEDVARVRESTDIVALIGEQLALKRVGSRYRGLCPFHQEKTPSFYVNPELASTTAWLARRGLLRGTESVLSENSRARRNGS